MHGPVRLVHGIVDAVKFDEARLAAPRAVVGVRVAVVPLHRARVESQLEVAGEIKISFGKRRVVGQLGGWKRQRVDLHHLAERVGEPCIAGGGKPVRPLIHAEPEAGHRWPGEAAAIDGEHVLQTGGFDR